MTQLESWIHESPDDKIVVFVQWRQLATLVGRKLEDNDIGFVYYTVSQEFQQNSSLGS